jgi:hypothetical protein
MKETGATERRHWSSTVIHTALEAWSWGFGAEDDELARFEIDDSPLAIRSYFEDEVVWRTNHLRREAKA